MIAIGDNSIMKRSSYFYLHRSRRIIGDFQWKTPKEVTQDFEHLKEEIADVLIYSYMLADNLGLDIDEIIKEKLEKQHEVSGERK